jgi:hypothetical protein
VSDLDTAVGRVLNDSKVFADFSNAVLGGAHTPADEAVLRQALNDWYYRYHTLMNKALPTDNPWGAGRLDAIAMIFNRLTGLDLGPSPNHVIPENIKRAEAPTRYPFLWNAFKQDKTQWPGFAPNDPPIYRLARNIGQVLGVFAEFFPEKDATGKVKYWVKNSMDLNGLAALESLTELMGPPRWPWALDNALVDQGAPIFERQCKGCHGDGMGLKWKTWIVPIGEVNTDFRELQLLERPASSGVLEGESWDLDGPLAKEDTALRILKNAVIGSLLNSTAVNGPFNIEAAKVKLRRVFTVYPEAGYEARVLQGVWAAAPYLHNGSVPTLTELLKPAAGRTPSFKIGPAYDPVAVGLAVEQPQVSTTLTTTDCSDRGSGNSRCGHEYGTTLPDSEKRALLEYLKRL